MCDAIGCSSINEDDFLEYDKIFLKGSLIKTAGSQRTDTRRNDSVIIVNKSGSYCYGILKRILVHQSLDTTLLYFTPLHLANRILPINPITGLETEHIQAFLPIKLVLCTSNVLCNSQCLIEHHIYSTTCL